MLSKKVEEVKKKYIAGTKIKLIKMYDEYKLNHIDIVEWA